MDNFRSIYRILCYLERAMDYDEPDLEQISARALNLSEQRWTVIMEMLVSRGYIDGIRIKRGVDGEIVLLASVPRITLQGLEYLQENSLMQKAARLANGIDDIVP